MLPHRFGLPREGRQAGIVAEEPVRLGGPAHPAVRDGDPLHLGHARYPRRLVAPEGLGGVVVADRRQAAAEDRRILDGHGAARRHVGAHRMAGVAEQDDPAAAPASCRSRSQIGITVTSVAASTTRRISGWKLREGGDELLARARQRQLLAVPGCCGHAAHQVDLVAPARHEVGEQVAVRPPPLGAVPHRVSPQPLGREDRPLRHPAGEARRLGPEQDVAHLGPDAVGADDDVGLCPCAVLEHEPDRVARRLQAQRGNVRRRSIRAGRRSRAPHAGRRGAR